MLRSMKSLLARDKTIYVNDGGSGGGDGGGGLNSSSTSSPASKLLVGRRSGSWRPSDGSASGAGVEISRDNRVMMQQRPQNLQLLSQ